MLTKLAVVTTGGTIGSVIKGETVGVSDRADKLVAEIRRLCAERNVDYDVFAPFNKNSENMTPGDWAQLDQCLREIAGQGYDRVVVTHGTDALAWTAGAIGLLHQGTAARICLTGAFLSLDFDGSDASLNLMAAIETVLSDATPPGVYVAFRRTEENRAAAIYRALTVQPMAFDEAMFRAAYDSVFGCFTAGEGLEITPPPRMIDYPSLPLSGPVPAAALEAAAGRILLLKLFPGLNVAALRPALEGFEAVVLDAYHSGTANAEEGPGSLMATIRDLSSQIPFLTAALPARYITRPYDSTAKLSAAGARVYKDLPAHTLFLYLSLGRAGGLPMADVLAALEDKRLSFGEGTAAKPSRR